MTPPPPIPPEIRENWMCAVIELKKNPYDLADKNANIRYDHDVVLMSYKHIMEKKFKGQKESFDMFCQWLMTGKHSGPSTVSPIDPWLTTYDPCALPDREHNPNNNFIFLPTHPLCGASLIRFGGRPSRGGGVVLTCSYGVHTKK